MKRQKEHIELIHPEGPQPVGSGSLQEAVSPDLKYDSALDAALIEDTFWEKAWDFLAGRNRAGQIFHKIAVAGIGLATGMNIDPITALLSQPIIQTGATMEFDFNWINLVLIAAGALLGLLTNKGILKGVLAGAADNFEQIIEKAREGREASSPRGRAYSNEELMAIFQEVEDLAMFGYQNIIRRWLAGLFGIRKRKQ